jgi:hypothetical protein
MLAVEGEVNSETWKNPRPRKNEDKDFCLKSWRCHQEESNHRLPHSHSTILKHTQTGRAATITTTASYV